MAQLKNNNLRSWILMSGQITHLNSFLQQFKTQVTKPQAKGWADSSRHNAAKANQIKKRWTGTREEEEKLPLTHIQSWFMLRW